MRAGTHALSLLSVPLNIQVLQSLQEEPKPLIELRRAIGSPPQTTMRAHLSTLEKAGIVERRRQNGFPGVVDYELTRPGHDLLAVAEAMRTWLERSPEGAIALGTPAAKNAIKALADGWSSTIVRAIASRPLSLTDLDRLIATHNYPSLERRLGALRLVGLIEPAPGQGRSNPYGASRWLRRAVAPILAAARWERRHLTAGAAPVGRLEVEAALLLTAPGLRMSSELSGSCRVAVEVPTKNGDGGLAGAVLEIEEGRVRSCLTTLKGTVDAWATGSVSDWLRATLQLELQALEVGGDCRLPEAIFEGIHSDLRGAIRSR